MTDCITDAELAAWASGAVTSERVSSIRLHVASCASCRTVVAEVSRTTGARPKPDTLGRYELREPVGAGGMGTVFSAWDPKLERVVAVKLLHEAAVDGHRAERFLLERQVLASLEHPHIARLLDAGETDEGRPWFAMDFIDGKPLDAACDDAKLTPRQRVELMLPVLRAVTVAHQHLVVHRDLKPSNVLVDRAGEPHLVDFGIARLLEGASGLTQTGMAPMTPAFASPEQVRREPAAVTSDVYSLGVVLYELLTGVSPYETKPGDVEALLLAVSSGEVKPPSEAVERASAAAVAARGLSREKLRAALQGDLDAIVMMALRKEPRDRYQSVQALTDDLTAALEGRATLARRGDRTYRAVLFVRRHRALVAGISAAFMALTVGLVTTIWQARRAEAERDLAQQRFAQVRSLAKAVLFDYHDGIADLPGSTALRERLVKDAQGYLETLAAQAGEDVELRKELAASYIKLGDVQGDPYGPSLGDTTSAKQSYLKGRELAESVLQQFPTDRVARRTLASSSEKLGAIEEVSGALEVALESYLSAAKLDRALLDEKPDDPDQKYALSRDEIAAGQTLDQLGRVDDSLMHLERSLALRREVVAARPDLESRKAVAGVLVSIARGRADQSRIAEAIAAAKESEEIFEALTKEFPDNGYPRRGRQIAWTVLNELYRRNDDRPGALAYVLKALAAARAMVAVEPENAVYRRDLVVSLQAASVTYSWLEDRVEQRKVIDEAIAINHALRTEDPENLQTVRDLVSVLELSMTLLDPKELPVAEQRVKEMEELEHLLIEEGGQASLASEGVAMAHDALATLFARARDFDRALAENQKVIDRIAVLVKDTPDSERLSARQTIALVDRAGLAVLRAEHTRRRADWEYARDACRTATLSVDANEALKNSQGDSHDEATISLPAFVARVDAALAGRPLPPLPPDEYR